MILIMCSITILISRLLKRLYIINNLDRLLDEAEMEKRVANCQAVINNTEMTQQKK